MCVGVLVSEVRAASDWRIELIDLEPFASLLRVVNINQTIIIIITTITITTAYTNLINNSNNYIQTDPNQIDHVDSNSLTHSRSHR